LRAGFFLAAFLEDFFFEDFFFEDFFFATRFLEDFFFAVFFLAADFFLEAFFFVAMVISFQWGPIVCRASHPDGRFVALPSVRIRIEQVGEAILCAMPRKARMSRVTI
jgi:hypothetical protein